MNFDEPTQRAVTPTQRVGRELRTGDLLLEKSGGGDKQVVGCVVLYDHDEPAVSSNFTARISVAPAESPPYWTYVHAALYSGKLNYLAIKQTTGIQNLDSDLYFDTLVGFPPLVEQEAIAAFLDRETERIDALIDKKRLLIERLQEYRTALITRTVTRGLPPEAALAAGLDPSPRLKPSAVEWLGDVPEHWVVRPLHALTEPYRPIIYGIVLPGPHVDEGVPIVKGGDVRDRVPAGIVSSNTTFELDESHARSRLVAGDLVFAIRGSVGDVAEVPPSLHGANMTQDAARISPIPEVNSTWLKHFLASDLAKDQVQANALGATISGINIRDLRRVLVPTPPRLEQDRIATQLASASARSDGLRNRLAIAIERLQEYRTALITAAVTGKIDVRASPAEYPIPESNGR